MPKIKPSDKKYQRLHTVQSLSCVQLCNPMTAACQAPLSSISRGLFKFLSTELEMLSNHLILCHPLLPLPSILPSIRVFYNELALQVTEELALQQHSSKEYSELISFRIDWFDLLTVQGTLKSLLQHNNSKASILQHSVFFVAQLSQTYMTNGKTIHLLLYGFLSAK